MNKNKLLLLISAALLLLPSCDNKKPIDCYPLNKIADHLYEYVLDKDVTYPSSKAVTKLGKGFACSAVQNGNLRGRNYDWTFMDTDLCIIHSTKTENRKHASVGTADLSFVEKDEKGHYDLSRIPFVTVDGINDAGVCVQVNVITYGENGTTFVHTEDTSDDINGAEVVRYVLDNAGSVEDAIALLKAKDIDTTYGTAEEFHWMISGPSSSTNNETKTVVMEKFPLEYGEIGDEQQLVFTEKFLNDKAIMTNFNVHNFSEKYDPLKLGTPEEKQMLLDAVKIGMGYERWEILTEYFDQGTSVMGMFDLMEKVWYSKFYDMYGEKVWYSELAGTILETTTYYKAHPEELAEDVVSLIGQEMYDTLKQTYGFIPYIPLMWGEDGPIYGDYSKAGIAGKIFTKVIEKYNNQVKDGSLWITVHTAVYDLDSKQLNIQVRESQDVHTFDIE